MIRTFFPCFSPLRLSAARQLTHCRGFMAARCPPSIKRGLYIKWRINHAPLMSIINSMSLLCVLARHPISGIDAVRVFAFVSHMIAHTSMRSLKILRRFAISERQINKTLQMKIEKISVFIRGAARGEISISRELFINWWPAQRNFSVEHHHHLLGSSSSTGTFEAHKTWNMRPQMILIDRAFRWPGREVDLVREAIIDLSMKCQSLLENFQVTSNSISFMAM